MQDKFKIGDKVKVHHYNDEIDMRWPKSSIGEVFTISDIVEDDGSFCVSGESSYAYDESELELVEAYKEPQKQKEITTSFTQAELQFLQGIIKNLIVNTEYKKDQSKHRGSYFWKYCNKDLDSPVSKKSFVELNQHKDALKSSTKYLKVLSEIQRKIKKLK